MSVEFDFYTVVRVKADLPNIKGQEGVIMGKAKNDHNEWSYAVFLYSENKSFSFMHSELEDTGRKENRDNFYPPNN